jgi:hypothetical protein
MVVKVKGVVMPGDLPAGVEHQPFAAEEAELLLIESSGTPNTGDPPSGCTTSRDLKSLAPVGTIEPRRLRTSD